MEVSSWLILYTMSWKFVWLIVTADEIEKQIKEGTMESLKSFFTFLADQHKLAIARLKDALSQIEEVSQEAEVMS